MKRKLLIGLLAICWILCIFKRVEATSLQLDSIQSIVDGATIDFELGGSVNSNLSAFNMMQTSGYQATSGLVYWVKGHEKAPISSHIMAGQITIETMAEPWYQIGISLIGTETNREPDFIAGMKTYDKNGVLLDTLTRNCFNPPSSASFSNELDWFDAGNSTATFIGIRSDHPIYSFELFSSTRSIAWDNLTFSTAVISSTPVPEPGTMLWLIGIGLTVFAIYRRKKTLLIT